MGNLGSFKYILYGSKERAGQVTFDLLGRKSKSLEFKPATYKRLQEWAGYFLVPETKLQKCLYFKGGG